jgi:UDPglucose 6-dehydrogenase
VDSPLAAVQDADSLAIVTEWQIFRAPDFDLLAATLRDK